MFVEEFSEFLQKLEKSIEKKIKRGFDRITLEVRVPVR